MPEPKKAEKVYKFVPAKCPWCGVDLSDKKPSGVELTSKARSGEEPFPDRYMAKCPNCPTYHFVVEQAPG